MALLSEKDAGLVKEQFAEAVSRPVKMAVYTSKSDCAYCDDTMQIAEELAGLSDFLTVEERDFDMDGSGLDVDKVPAIALLGQDDAGADVDYGIRFYGIPSGYEFMSLLDGIQTVGSGKVDLSAETLKFLETLTEDVHIQVFVTPPCPYCPRAVILAHHLAFASAKVHADMVEATEFPELSSRFNVMGVPRSVINGKIHQEGAVPEAMFLLKMQEAVG